MAKAEHSLDFEERHIMGPESRIPGAILVGVQTPGVDDNAHAASLAELGRLTNTLGYEVVATVSQSAPNSTARRCWARGKLKNSRR